MSNYRFMIKDYSIQNLIYDQKENGEFFDGYKEDKNPRTGKTTNLPRMFRFGLYAVLPDPKQQDSLSEYILPYRDVFYEKDKICVVYEAPLNYQNLHNYVINHPGPLPEEDVISFMHMIMRYICDLKESRYLSSALSPENIFLFHQGNNYKLLRFLGTSTQFHLQLNSSYLSPMIIRTPCISPELACGGKRFDSKSDVFSFGCISYFLMTKKYPFGNEDEKITIEGIKNHDGHFNHQITGHYSRALKDIVEACLHGQASLRPNPHNILKSPIFNRNSYNDLPLGIYVTPSVKWMPRGDIYTGNDQTYLNMMIAFKVSNMVSMEGIRLSSESIDRATATEESCTVPYDWVIPCTATPPLKDRDSKDLFGGVLPLFEGCLVIDGPQWDNTDHGNNNQFFPGRVISVLSNGGGCDKVTVEWLDVDRFHRYAYGGSLGRCEIIPAFPPLYHGLHVRSRGSYKGNPFKGIVHEILVGRRSFTILTENGNFVEISYGQEFNDPTLNNGGDATNYRFDVEIDPDFHTINYKKCKEIDEFLRLIRLKYSPIVVTEDNPKDDPKARILEQFQNHRGKSSNIDKGCFVKNRNPNAPPHQFYKVIDNDKGADPVLNRYDSNRVYLDVFQSIDGFVQCSYGNDRHPPVCIGDWVGVESNKEGQVIRICCENDNAKTWEYVILKIKTENAFRCYKYNELTFIRPGKK